MIAFGVAIGLFFAVAFCMAYGRAGNVRPRQLALLVALGGFLTLFLVPFLKYPGNPPSIGNPDTIRDRGALWLLMVVASVVCVIGATWLGRRLQARFGNWNATLLACAAFVVVMGAIMAVLPALGQLSANVEVSGSLLTETPQPLRDTTGAIVYPGFDADLLYRFRLYSVGAQVILWTAIGLGVRTARGARVPGPRHTQPAAISPPPAELPLRLPLRRRDHAVRVEHVLLAAPSSNSL